MSRTGKVSPSVRPSLHLLFIVCVCLLRFKNTFDPLSLWFCYFFTDFLKGLVECNLLILTAQVEYKIPFSSQICLPHFITTGNPLELIALGRGRQPNVPDKNSDGQPYKQVSQTLMSLDEIWTQGLSVEWRQASVSHLQLHYLASVQVHHRLYNVVKIVTSRLSPNKLYLTCGPDPPTPWMKSVLYNAHCTRRFYLRISGCKGDKHIHTDFGKWFLSWVLVSH